MVRAKWPAEAPVFQWTLRPSVVVVGEGASSWLAGALYVRNLDYPSLAFSELKSRLRPLTPAAREMLEIGQ